MAPKQNIIILLVTILSLFAMCFVDESNGKADENNNASTDDDYVVSDYGYYPGCEGTSGPHLLGITLYVNGEKVKMPAQVRSTDELKIAMKYSDADCNIAGGFIQITANEHDPKVFELIDIIQHYYDIETIGCSSREEGHPYFLNIDPNDYLLPEGLNRTLPMELLLDDMCGFPSHPYSLPLDFTVSDGETLIDGNDNPAQANNDNNDSGSGGCGS